MIAIVDYGMGNLRSVQKAFATVGHEAVVTRERRVLEDASHLVLPGVGAFADCMANLQAYDLIEPIRSAISRGKPFLGICLGLQLLFTESEEFGIHRGLDIIPGRVTRFPTGGELKVPHIGWNAVTVRRPAPPLAGIESGSHFYFVHSYVVEPSDPAVVAGTTDYGRPFVSGIWRDNVFACQFHPEKSQTLGLQIIRNFGNWQ
jgi:imidazole glycerol-phosphate synthase subunit HisH